MKDTNEFQTPEGIAVPNMELNATDGTTVNLSKLSGVSVVYAYPRTSPLDQPPIEGWDKIPGARGCTLQSKGYATHYEVILVAGANRVFGLSAQTSDYQKEAVERLSLPFLILSDIELNFASALGLPTFTAGGMNLFTRITLAIEDGRIRKVFFPVEDPAQNAVEVANYLSS